LALCTLHGGHREEEQEERRRRRRRRRRRSRDRDPLAPNLNVPTDTVEAMLLDQDHSDLSLSVYTTLMVQATVEGSEASRSKCHRIASRVFVHMALVVSGVPQASFWSAAVGQFTGVGILEVLSLVDFCCPYMAPHALTHAPAVPPAPLICGLPMLLF